MKRKTAWIISLIAIPFLAAASVLYAQKKDGSRGGQDEKVRAETRMADEQSRIDASEFDLQFIITDADGKPLNGVTMELERKRPRIPLLSGEWEKKTEKKTVDSKFRIQEKGWTGLDLRFLKDGYYLEDRSYVFDIIAMMNSAEASLHAVSNSTVEDEQKLRMKEDIQIKMFKGVPAADLVGSSGTLIYDFEKGRKTVFDLSAFDQKPEKPEKTKKTAVSAEDDELEEEEEYEEERTIEMKSFDLKTKPELTKYIELDFKRDENGEVLFDGMLQDTPCPASYIIRLHSDDPEDGFVAVDQLRPGFVNWTEYEKRYPTAPETGYRKELVFDFGKRGAEKRNYQFAFVKCGQHYGKISVWPAAQDGKARTILQVRVRIESLVLNRKEGDRNVSEGNFYREYKRPEGIIRNVPNKTEAKNEAKNVPEDKAETEMNAGPDDRTEPDLFAGEPLWNTERDGQPETRLRDLVNDAAKRAEVNFQSLGDVRITPIDAKHSYAHLDLDIVDEYGKVVRFFDEIEKKTPRLAWNRVELRVNSARDRIAAELQDAPPVAASAKSIRMSGRIRVIAYTPSADPSVFAGKKWNEEIPIAAGDTDFLTLLYDLSVSLPDDALVTDFRLVDGWKCEFAIQTRDRSADIPRHLRFPAWVIARVQRRVISNDVYSFSVALQKKDNPEPRKDSVTPDKKIAAIVALNLFDPEAVPRKAAASGMPASNDTRTNNAKDPEAELKQQLQKAINNQNEQKELLKTLSKTPGATKEQTDLVRQRLERNEQEIRRLREQQKKLRP